MLLHKNRIIAFTFYRDRFSQFGKHYRHFISIAMFDPFVDCVADKNKKV